MKTPSEKQYLKDQVRALAGRVVELEQAVEVEALRAGQAKALAQEAGGYLAQAAEEISRLHQALAEEEAANERFTEALRHKAAQRDTAMNIVAKLVGLDPVHPEDVR